jgi:hypothetical protein
VALPLRMHHPLLPVHLRPIRSSAPVKIFLNQANHRDNKVCGKISDWWVMTRWKTTHQKEIKHSPFDWYDIAGLYRYRNFIAKSRTFLTVYIRICYCYVAHSTVRQWPFFGCGFLARSDYSSLSASTVGVHLVYAVINIEESVKGQIWK